MNILVVSSTDFEIAGLISFLDKSAKKISFFEYSFKGHNIFPVVLGVGSFLTGYGMAKYNLKKIDLAIQIGVGGSFNKDLVLGSVVEVSEDCFADIGVTHSDGRFESIYDLSLVDENQFPFINQFIKSKNNILSNNLPKVQGITVNNVSGEENQILLRKKMYPNATLESMEGAAFLYSCAMNDLNCIQIRGISNYVEPRNKTNWNLELALNNLEKTTITLLEQID